MVAGYHRKLKLRMSGKGGSMGDGGWMLLAFVYLGWCCRVFPFLCLYCQLGIDVLLIFDAGNIADLHSGVHERHTVKTLSFGSDACQKGWP